MTLMDFFQNPDRLGIETAKPGSRNDLVDTKHHFYSLEFG
jgi:hypothetical protein